jgi:hypothetical protein
MNKAEGKGMIKEEIGPEGDGKNQLIRLTHPSFGPRNVIAATCREINTSNRCLEATIQSEKNCIR